MISRGNRRMRSLVLVFGTGFFVPESLGKKPPSRMHQGSEGQDARHQDGFSRLERFRSKLRISSPISNSSILRRGLSLQGESSRGCSSGAVGETGPVAFRRLPDKSVLQPM